MLTGGACLCDARACRDDLAGGGAYRGRRARAQKEAVGAEDAASECRHTPQGAHSANVAPDTNGCPLAPALGLTQDVRLLLDGRSANKHAPLCALCQLSARCQLSVLCQLSVHLRARAQRSKVWSLPAGVELLALLERAVGDGLLTPAAVDELRHRVVINETVIATD
eukprot:COSAG01_NODE_4039_length_5406_cov_1.715980_9_plen_167_part_00